MQWRLIGLPWRTKPRLPCERALKTESETGVINEFTFCSGSPVKKTNSAALHEMESRSTTFKLDLDREAFLCDTLFLSNKGPLKFAYLVLETKGILTSFDPQSDP